jgi:hypothetical protein
MQSIVNIIRQAAIENVWANPHIDKQYIFKPALISTKNGIRGNMRTPFVTINVPVTGRRFVIYEIGQLSPKHLGLDGNYMEWVRLDTVCNRQRMHIFAYIDNLMLPNHSIYVKRNTNRSLIFAVDHAINVEYLEKPNPFHIRFYSNAWYNTPAGQGVQSSDYYGGTLGEDIDVSSILTEWNRMRAYPQGKTFAFINGRYVDILNTAIMKAGDDVAIYHDGSVYESFDVSIDDIGSYMSSLDKDRKLLVMTPDGKTGKFHFQDDVEFFICNTFKKDAVTYTKGVYYPRERLGDVRQVTQQDWALRSKKVTEVILEQDGELPYTGAFIRVFLRNATGPLPYIQNANFTHDLFLLPYDERKRLMTGSGAVLPEWRADYLEGSYYNKWVSDYVRDLGPIADVFSYYGVNTYAEQFRLNPTNGLFHMPPMMMDGGFIMEFTATGDVIGKKILTAADYSVVYAATPGTYTIYAVPGKLVATAKLLDRISNFSGDAASAWDEVLMYEDSTGKWVFAENAKDYDIINGRIQWKGNFITNTRIRRDASQFLYRETTIERSQLGLPIPLFEDGSNTDSGHGFKRYDLWLNDKRLVYGVDFIVNFPNVTVRNYEYMIDGSDTGNLTILAHGVPPENKILHWGFVEDGLLSHDDRFNLHLYRNKSLFCDGLYVDIDYAAFGEGYKGSKNTTGKMPVSVREGALFMIQDPVSHVSQSDWLELGTTEKEALTRSLEIEGFLTKFFPQTPHPGVVAITHKHSLVSTLLRKLLEDMRDGVLSITRLDISDVAVGVYLKPYATYINQDAHNLNAKEAYIQIRGHGFANRVTLTQAEYNFMVRVNALYLNNRVVLSDFYMF